MQKTEYLKKSLETLKSGGVLLYPTDTVWGLGCDATQPEAVERIYRIKKRTDRKSMLILVNQPEMISGYVTHIPSIAWELIDAATNPLTLIFTGAKNLAPNLPGNDMSIGIRVCKHTFCNDLIYRLKKPIVSTSANISGDPWPVTFKDISQEIKNKVDYIVPPAFIGGSAKPSSIIRIGLHNEIEILRK